MPLNQLSVKTGLAQGVKERLCCGPVLSQGKYDGGSKDY